MTQDDFFSLKQFLLSPLLFGFALGSNFILTFLNDVFRLSSLKCKLKLVKLLEEFLHTSNGSVSCLIKTDSVNLRICR